MSNPTVLTTFANPDPLVTIQTTQELIDLLNALVATSIQGTYIPYVIGSTTPNVGDQDKAWVRIDGSGRPKGTYVFYSGAWRKEPTGLTHETRMFTGNPATYFDSSGLGLQSPDDWDGWAIANGGNGTEDKSNLFIVGGDMSNGAVPPLVQGYTAGKWNTKVTGDTLSTGGSPQYTLTNDNLPFIDIQLTGYNASSDSHAEKKAIVTGAYNSGASNTTEVAKIGPDPTTSPPGVQKTVPTVPPFYVLAFCDWVGYA